MIPNEYSTYRNTVISLDTTFENMWYDNIGLIEAVKYRIERKSRIDY